MTGEDLRQFGLRGSNKAMIGKSLVDTKFFTVPIGTLSPNYSMPLPSEPFGVDFGVHVLPRWQLRSVNRTRLVLMSGSSPHELEIFALLRSSVPFDPRENDLALDAILALQDGPDHISEKLVRKVMRLEPQIQ